MSSTPTKTEAIRRWARAATRILCGYNPEHVIEPDTWHQLVKPPGLKRELIRCARCAGEIVPPDVTESVKQYERFTKPMVPLQRAMRKDIKALIARNDD